MFDFEFTEHKDKEGVHAFSESVLTTEEGVTYAVLWYVQDYKYPFMQVLRYLDGVDPLYLSCEETKLF